MSRNQAIKHYEQKHNISIIYDQNEKTYAIYKDNRLLGYVYSLLDIDDYMRFKNDQAESNRMILRQMMEF
jgi:hypothetical protein